MNKMTARLIPLLLTLVTTCALNAQTPSAAPPAASDARKAFDKLKSLSGSWQGNVMGVRIAGTIRSASSGTAILHEMTTDAKGPPQQEITMFYVEEGRLLGVHYCDGNNRVRWEGTMSADGTTIEFKMLDVSGGTKGGLLKRLVFTFRDAATHEIEGLFIMPDGKPVDLRGEFRRTP